LLICGSMARYQHLPVFQDCYDYILEIHKRVEKFPRIHRYSIGERLKDLSFELLDLVVGANQVKDKRALLVKAIGVMEKLKIYIRLCFDLKILGEKGFEYMVRKLDCIGRQLTRWKDWANALRS